MQLFWPGRQTFQLPGKGKTDHVPILMASPLHQMAFGVQAAGLGDPNQQAPMAGWIDRLKTLPASKHCGTPAWFCSS